MTETVNIEIASIEGAICNPKNPRHFMVIQPARQMVSVYRGRTLLAQTDKARRIVEVGRTIYDPVFYIPKEDLMVPFKEIEKESRCPLKGQASYYVFDGEEIAWSYTKPFDFAAGLADHFAFWPSKVRIEEGQ